MKVTQILASLMLVGSGLAAAMPNPFGKPSLSTGLITLANEDI
jgi:hypothetical protein